MAKNVLVDTGFLVALLSRRDTHHGWARTVAAELPPPWFSCDAVLSEAFFLIGSLGAGSLALLLRRGALQSQWPFAEHMQPVLALMDKYRDVAMSFADACLVRMTEVVAEPLLLTTDDDFRLYRRLGRQVVPCLMPEIRHAR